MLLREFFQSAMQLTDPVLIDELVENAWIRTVKQGTYVFRQGENRGILYLIMNGVLRGFLPDANGKELTDCLCFRCGQSAMPDWDLTQPASINIEALTDCVLVCLRLDFLHGLMQRYPEILHIYQRMMLDAAAAHRDLKIAVYQYTAEQRYQWFLKAYPGLIDQVRHKHIASFLNMTPVTLSKLRHRLQEEKGEQGEQEVAPEEPPEMPPAMPEGMLEDASTEVLEALLEAPEEIVEAPEPT